MLEKGESKVLLRYILNVLTSKKINPKIVYALGEWIEGATDQLGLNPMSARTVTMIEELGELQQTSKFAFHHQWELFLEKYLVLLRSRLKKLEIAHDSQLTLNLRMVQEYMGLSDYEHDLLGLIIRYHRNGNLEEFCDTACRGNNGSYLIISLMIGIPQHRVKSLLDNHGCLFRFGLVKTPSFLPNGFAGGMDINEKVIEAICQCDGTFGDFRQRVLGSPATTSLCWEDFEHLQPAAERLSVFLREAINRKLQGINILLYGPPGTGKTEFSMTLAQQLGMTIYPVGEADDDGDEPCRRERLAGLRLAQTLLQDQADCLLLFDEMDDLFQGGIFSLLLDRRNTASKVFGNRLMERNPVPTIWTINDPGFLDASILRRMSLALELKNPPQAARQRVWQRLLDNHGVSVSTEDQSRFASQESVSPAVAENAIRFASLTGGRTEDICFAVESMVKVMTGRKPELDDARQSGHYLVELVNADVNLPTLTEKLVASQKRTFSLCLNGPPGTGKSAYARHLAACLGLGVMQRRASDLLGMFVGQSEKNIARMFEQARDEGKLLILDEADSLLADRSGAHRSWEVTQVNEMLTWMETHPLPFICTTNLIDSLDQASMRRFTFKIHFDYLRLENAQLAFRHFFNCSPGDQVQFLTHLTPGDFAVVKRKAELLGHLEEPAALLDMLIAEQNVKKGYRTSVGFKLGE